jgi:hypothetical protein
MQNRGVKTILTAFFDAKGTDFQESGSWYFLYDNAPAHSSGTVYKFLAKGGIPMLSHPPYSPNSAPDNFFYFLIKNCNERDEI